MIRKMKGFRKPMWMKQSKKAPASGTASASASTPALKPTPVAVMTPPTHPNTQPEDRSPIGMTVISKSPRTESRQPPSPRGNESRKDLPQPKKLLTSPSPEQMDAVKRNRRRVSFGDHQDRQIESRAPVTPDTPTKTPINEHEHDSTPKTAIDADEIASSNTQGHVNVNTNAYTQGKVNVNTNANTNTTIDHDNGRCTNSELKATLVERNREIRSMHDKFHAVQDGLLRIDEERDALMERTTSLEDESKALRRKLDVREQEILSLVKRCAAQELKVKELAKLRKHNRDLSESLHSVRNKLHDVEHEQDELEKLRKELRDSELSREELVSRLDVVQRDHDKLAETLSDCLSNMRRLTEEKELLQLEWQREVKQIAMQLERERIDHISANNDLKAELQRKNDKMAEAEQNLQKALNTNNDIRQTKVQVSQEHSKTVNDLKVELDEVMASVTANRQKINDVNNKNQHLEEELERTSSMLTSRTNSFEAKVHELNDDLHEKEIAFVALEIEFSDQMEELMRKSCQVDELLEEKAALEEKLADFNVISTKYAGLQEYMALFDSTVVDVTTENAYLTLEKETLHEEIAELENKIELLESITGIDHYQVQSDDMQPMGEDEDDDIDDDCARLNPDACEGMTNNHAHADKRSALHEQGSIQMMPDSGTGDLSDPQAATPVERRSPLDGNADQAEGMAELGIVSMETTIRQLEHRLRQQKEDHATALKKLEDEVEQLNQTKDEMSKELANTASLRERADDKVINLQAELSESNEMLASMTSTLSLRNDAMTHLNNELIAARELHDTMVVELSSTKHQLEESEGLVQKLQGQCAEADAARASQHRNLRNAIKEKETLQSTVDETRSCLTALKADLCAANQIIEEKARKEALLVALTAEKQGMEQTLCDANEQIDNLKEEIDRRSSDCANCMRELESRRLAEIATQESMEELRSLHETQQQSLKSELEAMRLHVGAVNATLAQKTDELAEMQKELAETKQELDKERRLKEAIAASAPAAAATLSLVKDEAATMDTRTKGPISPQSFMQLEQAMSDQEEELRRLERACNNKDIEMQDLVEVNDCMHGENQKLKTEISNLENVITKLQTEVALKTDEIRDLRLLDLKDANEMIVCLEEQMLELELGCQEKESTIQKLRQQLQQSQKKKEQMEEDIASTTLPLPPPSRRKIGSDASIANEKGVMIACLAQHQSELEREKIELRGQLDQVKKVAQQLKDENSALQDELKQVMDESEACMKELEEQLETERANGMLSAKEQREKVKELESILDQRSTLLADMVKYNKEIQCKWDADRLKLLKHEEDAKENGAACTAQISNLRQQLKSVEGKHRQEMERRGEQCRILEADLAKIKVKVRGSSVDDNKVVAELQKENGKLKDKISRQEAYLQRKLQKEKEQRGRSLRSALPK